MKLLGIDHVHVLVRDLALSKGFFEFLGFAYDPSLTGHVDAVGLRASQGGVFLELQTVKPAENPGWNHIALLVEDLDAAVKELDKAGVRYEGPINAPSGRRIVNLRDPSGFLWQLVDARHR